MSTEILHEDIKVIDFILEQCLLKSEVTLQDLINNGLIALQQGEGLEFNVLYNPRDEFKRFLQIIEKHDLCKVKYFIDNEIAEKNSNTSPTVIRGGFKPIFEKIQLENEKERVEFEKSKLDLHLKKWQKKTFWWFFTFAIIGCAFSIFNFTRNLSSKED